MGYALLPFVVGLGPFVKMFLLCLHLFQVL